MSQPLFKLACMVLIIFSLEQPRLHCHHSPLLMGFLGDIWFIFNEKEHNTAILLFGISHLLYAHNFYFHITYTLYLGCLVISLMKPTAPKVPIYALILVSNTIFVMVAGRNWQPFIGYLMFCISDLLLFIRDFIYINQMPTPYTNNLILCTYFMSQYILSQNLSIAC